MTVFVLPFDDFLDISQDGGEPLVRKCADHDGVLNETIKEIVVDVAPNIQEYDREFIVRSKYRQ
jgi:hypothetical protein